MCRNQNGDDTVMSEPPGGSDVPGPQRAPADGPTTMAASAVLQVASAFSGYDLIRCALQKQKAVSAAL